MVGSASTRARQAEGTWLPQFVKCRADVVEGRVVKGPVSRLGSFPDA